MPKPPGREPGAPGRAPTITPGAGSGPGSGGFGPVGPGGDGVKIDPSSIGATPKPSGTPTGPGVQKFEGPCQSTEKLTPICADAEETRSSAQTIDHAPHQPYGPGHRPLIWPSISKRAALPHQTPAAKSDPNHGKHRKATTNSFRSRVNRASTIFLSFSKERLYNPKLQIIIAHKIPAADAAIVMPDSSSDVSPHKF